MSENASKRETVQQRFLQKTVSHFLEFPDFNGLVVSNFVEAGNIPWPEAKAMLSELVRTQRITLNFAEMNPFVKLVPDLPVDQQLEKLAGLNAPGILCAYPSAAIIADTVAGYSDRPFSQMFVAGGLHLELLFFDLTVLEMYDSDPRYHFEFRCYSGWISIRDDFYLGKDTPERDKIYLKSFGLGYDARDRRVLAVYLTDLAKLSPEHQQYWRTKRRTDECRVLKEYKDNTLRGIWVDTVSVYGALLQEQVEINKLCGLMGRPPLFRDIFENSWPRGYSIFWRPTKRNFLNFVHTLDKMLSDNINKEFFKGEISDKEMVDHPDGTRESKPLATLTMLKNWLAGHIRFAEPEGLKALLEPLREVRNLRSRNAHQLIEDEHNEEYHDKQDRLVADVQWSLASLRQLFSTHPAVSEYEPPDFLNPDKLRMF